MKTPILIIDLSLEVDIIALLCQVVTPSRRQQQIRVGRQNTSTEREFNSVSFAYIPLAALSPHTKL